MSIPERKNGQTILAEWFNTLRTWILSITINHINTDVDFSSWGEYNTLIVDASSNTVDVTMPDPTQNTNKTFTIIIEDITNAVELLPFAAESIAFQSSYSFRMKGESIKLFSNGVNWYAI